MIVRIALVIAGVVFYVAAYAAVTGLVLHYLIQWAGEPEESSGESRA